METFNHLLEIITATMLLFASLALISNLNQGRHLWAGVGFTLAVFCYTVIESAVKSGFPLCFLLFVGSASVPFFFWLLSKSIFEDHFRFTPNLLLWFVVQNMSHVHHFLNTEKEWSPTVVSTFNIVAQLTSLGFVASAMYVAIRTRPSDLIERRLSFRNGFIATTAVLIGVTLIVESTPLITHSKDLLQILQRLTILVLTTYFLLSNFAFRSGFFFQEPAKPRAVVPHDPQLELQLKELLDEKKIYRKEGLTIKALAETMQLQEYRLRRLINGQLGFKNFNDFLNQYRVNEACEILRDPAQNQKTILEIAYQLGYQSIGPFNKAFRELKGTTPTAYRKMPDEPTISS
jgi:AraC-like DNA-binding protein